MKEYDIVTIVNLNECGRLGRYFSEEGEVMDLNGIRVSSYIPGRIRLKALQIKGNPALAQRITDYFRP